MPRLLNMGDKDFQPVGGVGVGVVATPSIFSAILSVVCVPSVSLVRREVGDAIESVVLLLLLLLCYSRTIQTAFSILEGQGVYNAMLSGCFGIVFGIVFETVVAMLRTFSTFRILYNKTVYFT